VFLAALTVVSSLGLHRVFIGMSWFGPVVACVLTGHVVCWAGRRWRLPQIPALLLALVAYVLVGIWTLVGSSTWFGVPDSTTWSHLVAAVRQAQRDFSSSVPPVEPTMGFKLLAVAGAGVVTILSDWIAFRWRSGLLATVPAFVMFAVGAGSGQGPGRQWIVALEVVALLSFVVVQRAVGTTGGQVWFAGVRTGVVGWSMRAAAMTGALVVGTSLLLTPFLNGEDGRGVLGWRGGIGPGSGGNRIVSNPIVDLQTRLIDLSNVSVFTVDTPVPSYWRLTSLDTFTGSTWVATGSYRGFGSRLPGTSSVPPGTKTIQDNFQILSLNSPWLPSAFNPVSVQGIGGVSYDPNSESLLSSSRTSNGLDYSVTSYEYLSTLSKSTLEAAPPLTNLGSLQQDLQLPQISPSITALAAHITAGKTTEYDKALAIQDYLRSPPFTYTLHPVSDGSGEQAISNFLFQTHQGYCQQYAGAYAVLARAVGLPTRLAVGFATGTPISTQTYQVYNSDAHTWPEVYFGPKYGWLPFEPTPSFSEPDAPYTQVPTSTPSPSPTGDSSQPTIQKQPPSAKGSATTLAPSSTSAVATASGGNSGGSFASIGPVLIALAVVVGWVLVIVGGRRLRWAVRRERANREGVAAAVLVDWEKICEMLAWRGVPRAPAETDDEYAVRASRIIAQQADKASPRLARGVARLAGLARQAKFARQVPTSASAEAGEVAGEIRHGLFRTANARQLLVWAVVPRPGRRAGAGA
jgi:transglutaminase-like putative cysteine protease